MTRKFVLRSTIVRMALLSLSTIKSISQSPNRLPSTSLGRSCMLALFLMPWVLVSCLCQGLWRYFILCRQFVASVPLVSLRSILSNGLVRYLYTLLCKVAGYLFGRPLLPSDEFFYAPGERLAHGAVSQSTMHTALRKGIGLVPDCFMGLFLLFFQAIAYLCSQVKYWCI